MQKKKFGYWYDINYYGLLELVVNYLIIICPIISLAVGISTAVNAMPFYEEIAQGNIIALPEWILEQYAVA